MSHVSSATLSVRARIAAACTRAGREARSVRLLAVSKTQGPEAVAKAIAAEPAFQVDGKFNAERYQLLLSSQVPALTPLKFEETP